MDHQSIYLYQGRDLRPESVFLDVHVSLMINVRNHIPMNIQLYSSLRATLKIDYNSIKDTHSIELFVKQINVLISWFFWAKINFEIIHFYVINFEFYFFFFFKLPSFSSLSTSGVSSDMGLVFFCVSSFCAFDDFSIVSFK